jgi:hypothetical protein
VAVSLAARSLFHSAPGIERCLLASVTMASTANPSPPTSPAFLAARRPGRSRESCRCSLRHAETNQALAVLRLVTNSNLVGSMTVRRRCRPDELFSGDGDRIILNETPPFRGTSSATRFRMR